MMHEERRECNGCNYPVTYMVISGAHDPYKVTQFVSIMLEGALAGRSVTTDNCPKCGRELNRMSTRPVGEIHKSSMRRE